MRVFGFVEGQNLTVLPNGFGVPTTNWPSGRKPWSRPRPTSSSAGPDNYTRELQRLTRTIPLIAMTEDMVAAGLVGSLARPGGNTTGISLLRPNSTASGRRFCAEAVPGLRKMAALADSTVTPQRHLDSLQDAARKRGFELSVFGVAKREEVVPAIEAAKAAGAQALNLLATPLFTVNRARLH